MANITIAARLIDVLYTEAMLLTDETRSYFDHHGPAERAALPPELRVEFACEALKATTRLMQIVAWLLTMKSASGGDVEVGDVRSLRRRLGAAPPFDPHLIIAFPEEAQRLLAAGADLYDRVARLEAGAVPPEAVDSPARSLIQRLERSL